MRDLTNFLKLIGGIPLFSVCVDFACQYRWRYENEIALKGSKISTEDPKIPDRKEKLYYRIRSIYWESNLIFLSDYS